MTNTLGKRDDSVLIESREFRLLSPENAVVFFTAVV
jgi:hypothetical protein